MPFVAALWMAILLALVCALAPLGPPSSRQAGSAFNPATSAVALKSRSSVPIALLQAADPDGSDRPLPKVAFPISMARAPGAMPAAAFGTFIRMSPAGFVSTFQRARRLARAPPFSF